MIYGSLKYKPLTHRYDSTALHKQLFSIDLESCQKHVQQCFGDSNNKDNYKIPNDFKVSDPIKNLEQDPYGNYQTKHLLQMLHLLPQ